MSTPSDDNTDHTAMGLDQLRSCLLELLARGEEHAPHAPQQSLLDRLPHSSADAPARQRALDSLMAYCAGDLDEACTHLQQLHERTPDDREITLCLAFLRCEAGDYQQAAALYDRVSPTPPKPEQARDTPTLTDRPRERNHGSL